MYKKVLQSSGHVQGLAYIVQLAGAALVSVPISYEGITKYPRQTTIHIVLGILLQCLAFIQVTPSLGPGSTDCPDTEPSRKFLLDTVRAAICATSMGMEVDVSCCGVKVATAFIGRPSLDSRFRRSWNVAHWWNGRLLLLLGIALIYDGLLLYRSGKGAKRVPFPRTSTTMDCMPCICVPLQMCANACSRGHVHMCGACCAVHEQVKGRPSGEAVTLAHRLHEGCLT